MEKNINKNIRILIVDDEDYIRELLYINLKPLNYDIETAEDVEQALQKIKQTTPDIIISDIIMPEVTGLEFCKIIKTNPEYKNIYFILLTARVKLDEKIEGFTVGADDYITKPFKIKELLARIKVGVRLISYNKYNQELITSLNNKIKTIEEQNIKLQDMTDKIIRLEKLSTIGKMSSAIAHELRNPLCSLKSNLWLLKNKPKEINKVDVINKMEIELDNSTKIIDNILSFCKIKKPVLEKNNLSELIYSVLVSLNKPSDITINLDIPKNIFVICDKIQLKIVIKNILKNSIEAYIDNKKNGNIDVSTKIKNNQVIIDFTDYAGGIKTDNINEIYDFFVSTKQFGTGLGLSFSKYIIESHNGNISVDSEKEKTSVLIKLPV